MPKKKERKKDSVNRCRLVSIDIHIDLLLLEWKSTRKGSEIDFFIKTLIRKIFMIILA